MDVTCTAPIYCASADSRVHECTGGFLDGRQWGILAGDLLLVAIGC